MDKIPVDELIQKALADALFATSASEDLVKQFRNHLRDVGCVLDPDSYDPHCKVFGATLNNRSIVVLAHESELESGKIGWWGIRKAHIEGLRKIFEAPTDGLGNSQIDWGAVLIDRNPAQGYWVRGEHILELIDIELVRLDSQGKYHFNANVLESQSELALYFSSIGRFLGLSGLAGEKGSS